VITLVSRVVSQRADPAKLVFYAELRYDAWPEDKRGGQSAVAPLARNPHMDDSAQVSTHAC
jgi:hypothetical protein